MMDLVESCRDIFDVVVLNSPSSSPPRHRSIDYRSKEWSGLRLTRTGGGGWPSDWAGSSSLDLVSAGGGRAAGCGGHKKKVTRKLEACC